MDNTVLHDTTDINEKLLALLLTDKTSKKNIIWATNNYAELGEGYQPTDEIKLSAISGEHAIFIQPRVMKAADEQTMRTRDKAEVFTPSWICNAQNNLVDNAWFGRENVFNTKDGTTWHTTVDTVVFSDCGKSWQKYVDVKRMEISCGEAPYLVSRYDTVSGKMLPFTDRIGLLDRKLRVVNENTETYDDWYHWTVRAFQSIYGYEFQGDNLLLARKNLLLTFIEDMEYRWHKKPSKKELEKIANIIVWNLWQMDGLTRKIPFAQTNAHPLLNWQEEQQRIDCVIHDWRAKETRPFATLLKGDN